MTEGNRLGELAELVDAALAAMGGPVQRTETPDYAQLDSDCFMAMCVKPNEMMGLFDALPEIAAALRARGEGSLHG
jgi:hypothetical protein